MSDLKTAIDKFIDEHLHNPGADRKFKPDLDALLNAVVEECCKGNCLRCKEGKPVWYDKDGRRWHGYRNEYYACGADRIASHMKEVPK